MMPGDWHPGDGAISWVYALFGENATDLIATERYPEKRQGHVIPVFRNALPATRWVRLALSSRPGASDGPEC